MQFIKTTREVSQYYGTDYTGKPQKLYQIIPKNTILELWIEDHDIVLPDASPGIRTIATTPRPNQFLFMLERDQYEPLGIVQVNVGGDKGTGRLIDYTVNKADGNIFTCCKIEFVTGDLDDHLRNGELWVLFRSIEPTG